MNFDLLLKTQQELHLNNAKWNQAITQIKEITIFQCATQKEFEDEVDKIIKQCFRERQNDK